MFYIVYKTTCLINGKIYVGKHQTDNLDDGYLGSGKLLRRAIKKYGRGNFKSEVLHLLDTEKEMDLKEAELVTEEFCLRDDNYNLCVGGRGGWSYVNREGLAGRPDPIKISELKRGKKRPDLSKRMREWHAKGLVRTDTFTGRKHTPDAIEKMKKSHIGLQDGNKNSQFGTFWITNGIENKKAKAVDLMPKGWYKGRSLTVHTSHGRKT